MNMREIQLKSGLDYETSQQQAVDNHETVMLSPAVSDLNEEAFHAEYHNGVATIIRDKSSGRKVKVYFRTLSGTAISGVHFMPVNNSVVFEETDRMIDIPIEVIGGAEAYGAYPATAFQYDDRFFIFSIYRIEGGAGSGISRAFLDSPKDYLLSKDAIAREAFVIEYPAEKEIKLKETNETGTVPQFYAPMILDIHQLGRLPYTYCTRTEIRARITFKYRDKDWRTTRYVLFGDTKMGLAEGAKDQKLPKTYRETEWALCYGRKDTDSSEQLEFTFPNGSMPKSEDPANVYEVFDQRVSENQDKENEYVKYPPEQKRFGLSFIHYQKENGYDTGYMENLQCMLQFCDTSGMTFLGFAPMPHGSYFVGNPISLVLIFDKIVDSCDVEFRLQTNVSENSFKYYRGIGTNTLVYLGTIEKASKNGIVINSYEVPDVKDPRGNSVTDWGDTQKPYFIDIGPIGDKIVAELKWNNAQERQYNPNALPVTAEVTNLLTGEDADACTVTVKNGDQKEPGTYIAVATELSNDQYELPVGYKCAVTYTIRKAELDIYPDLKWQKESEQEVYAMWSQIEYADYYLLELRKDGIKLNLSDNQVPAGTILTEVGTIRLNSAARKFNFCGTIAFYGNGAYTFSILGFNNDTEHYVTPTYNPPVSDKYTVGPVVLDYPSNLLWNVTDGHIFATWGLVDYADYYYVTLLQSEKVVTLSPAMVPAGTELVNGKVKVMLDHENPLLARLFDFSFTLSKLGEWEYKFSVLGYSEDSEHYVTQDSNPPISPVLVYTVPKKLDTPTGLVWDNYVARWNAVNNADYYEVELTDNGVQLYMEKSATNLFDFTKVFEQAEEDYTFTVIACSNDTAHYLPSDIAVSEPWE